MCCWKSALAFSVRAACTCAVARTGIIGVHIILIHIKGFKGVILIIICSKCAAAQCLLMPGAKSCLYALHPDAGEKDATA